MSSSDEWLKKYQEDATNKLLQELAEADARAAKDPLKTERKAFLFELGLLRLRKNVSQSELALRTGLKQPYISRIESGKANPSLNTLLKIAKALEADLMLEYSHGKNPHNC